MSLCLSFFICSSVAFSSTFFFKMKHTLCYRDTVKANLILSYVYILLTNIIEERTIYVMLK